jgi:hypothetical protein
MDAKEARDSALLLRRRRVRWIGLVLGTLVAFLIGGWLGVAGFLVLASVAGLVAYGLGRWSARV